MKRIALSADPRGEIGKGANRRLRKTGKVPAVLYGRKSDTVMLTIDLHQFLVSTSKIGDEMVMFTLSAPEAGVKNQLTMIREVQRDPVTERITHLDLMRVDVSKPVDIVVPVHGEGIPIGIQEGGQLEHVSRTVHLRCLIDDIPDHIPVDLAGLTMGQAFHVSELKLSDRITILSHPNEVLFLVAAPRKEEEVAPVAEAAVEGAEGEAAEAKPEEEKKEEEKE